MKLKAKSVSRKLPEYKQIKQLMKRAFPKNEQMPVWVLRILALNKGTDFLAWYGKGAFCGISFTVQHKNMAFILYLAVNDKIRSKGYGSAVLNCLKKKFKGKTLSLNVEPLERDAANYTQRVRRIYFYKKNGFRDTGYFIHDKNDKYLILSTAETFSQKEYREMLKKVSYGFYTPQIEMSG